MTRVRVIYKNGHIEEISCSEFGVKKDSSGILFAVDWADAWPKPLYLGVDNIAAIYEIDEDTKEE